jgi:short-subunit dehydrogenase
MTSSPARADDRRRRRLVWITGGSSGIGRALSLMLARRGERVAISARNEAALEALVEEARRMEGEMHAYPLDVTETDAVSRTVAAIERDLGDIDLAVLNAGTHRPVSAADFKATELESLIQVNLIGTARCLESLLAPMMARRGGHIAIVASVAGYRGLPTAAYYGASKAALINLAEALKFDLDQAGVRLQLIEPGFVETPLTDKNDFPMPFLIDVETAAARIVAGVERSAFEITFPRRFTVIMKLLRLLPYRLYFPLVGWMTGSRQGGG